MIRVKRGRTEPSNADSASLTQTSAKSSLFFLIQTLSGFAALTLGVHLYGARSYGIWLTVLATTNFLGLAVAGLPLRTLTQLARLLVPEERADTYAAGVRYAAATCSAAACALTVAWLFLPDAAVSWTYGNLASARSAALVVFAGTLLIQPSTVAIYAMAGLHDVAGQQRYLAARAVMRLCSVGVAGVCSHRILTLAAFTIAGDAAVGGAAIVDMRRRLALPVLGRIVQSRNRALRRGGVELSIIQAELAVIGSADAIVISAFVGPSLVTAYIAGQRLFLLLGSVLSAIQAPLWPAYSRAFANREQAWIDTTYRAIISLTTTITAAAVLLGGVVIPIFVPVWLGPDVHVSRALTVVLGMNAGVAAYVGIHGILLTSLDRLRPQVKSYAFEALANVVLSILLVRKFGVIGVAIGTLLPAMAVGGHLLPAAVSTSIFRAKGERQPLPMSFAQAGLLGLGIACLLAADLSPFWLAFLLLSGTVMLSILIVWVGRRPVLVVVSRLRGFRRGVPVPEGSI